MHGPQMLPGGEWVLFSVVAAPSRSLQGMQPLGLPYGVYTDLTGKQNCIPGAASWSPGHTRVRSDAHNETGTRRATPACDGLVVDVGGPGWRGWFCWDGHTPGPPSYRYTN